MRFLTCESVRAYQFNSPLNLGEEIFGRKRLCRTIFYPTRRYGNTNRECPDGLYRDFSAVSL